MAKSCEFSLLNSYFVSSAWASTAAFLVQASKLSPPHPPSHLESLFIFQPGTSPQPLSATLPGGLPPEQHPQSQRMVRALAQPSPIVPFAYSVILNDKHAPSVFSAAALIFLQTVL